MFDIFKMFNLLTIVVLLFLRKAINQQWNVMYRLLVVLNNLRSYHLLGKFLLIFKHAEIFHLCTIKLYFSKHSLLCKFHKNLRHSVGNNAHLSKISFTRSTKCITRHFGFAMLHYILILCEHFMQTFNKIISKPFSLFSY